MRLPALYSYLFLVYITWPLQLTSRQQLPGPGTGCPWSVPKPWSDAHLVFWALPACISWFSFGSSPGSLFFRNSGALGQARGLWLSTVQEESLRRLCVFGAA